MKLEHHTPEYLKERLAYDPFDGTLWWKFHVGKDPRWSVRYAGTQALTAVDSIGYNYGYIDGKKYRAHRVIWAMMYGWPEHEIDHKDHDRTNNMLHNLRAVTASVNGMNKSLLSNNISGVPGVWYDHVNSKWATEIKQDRKKHFLGRYVVFEDAVRRRKAAEFLYGFHENHGT